MSTSNANVFVSDVFSQQPRVNEQTSMAEKKDESFVFAEIHNSLLHNLLYKLNNALKKQKSNSFSTSIDTFQTNILAKLDNILQYVSSKSSQETINILNSDATVDILSRLSNISLENIKMMHMKQPLLGQTLQRLGALDRILQCPLSALNATVETLKNYTTLYMLLDEFTMIPLTFDLLDENFEKFQKMMNFIHEKKINCRELNKFQLEKKNGQQKNSQQSLRILMLQWYRTLTKMYAQLFQRFFPKRHETTLDMTNTIKIFQKEKELQKMLGIFRDSFRLLNTPQERWEFLQIFDRHTGLYHHAMSTFDHSKMTIGSKSASSYYFSSPPLQTSSSILLSTTTDTSISTTGNKRPNEDNSLQNSTIIDTKLVKVKKMKLENNVIARAIDLYNTSTVPEGNIHGNKKDIIRQQRLAAGALKKIYIYFKKREGSKWRKRTLHELNEAIVHLVKFRKLAKIDHASLAQNISKAIDYVSKAWEQELHEKTLKNQELWDRLTACRNKFQMYQKSLQDPLSELTMSKKNKKQTQLPATPVDKCKKLLAKLGGKHQDLSPLTRQMILLQQELLDAMTRGTQQQLQEQKNDDNQVVIYKSIEQENEFVEKFTLKNDDTNDDLVVNNPLEEIINCLEDMDYSLRQDRLEMRKTKSSTFTREHRLLWFQVLSHVLEFISQLPVSGNIYKIQVYHILQGLRKRNQIFSNFFLSNEKSMARCEEAIRKEEDVTV